MSQESASKQRKSGYLPSLDGWRAISILAVLANHSATFYVHGSSLRWLQNFGGTFVRLFFAISGYLICTRILEEETRLGRFRIKDFYIRRFFRIQPAAIVYLIAIGALVLLRVVAQRWNYWFGALFLYRNYQLNLFDPATSAEGVFTGHFWTLSVEEHFYLLLSVFLFWVRSRRLLWGSILALISLIWFEYCTMFPSEAQTNSSFRQTGTQLSYLVIPALFALLLRREDVRSWASRWMQPGPIIFFSVVGVFIVQIAKVHVSTLYGTTHPAVVRAFPMWHDTFSRTWPFWVIATVLHPESITTRLLELGWLRWIGRISYSLYLWHILFSALPWQDYAAFMHTSMPAWTRFPWNILGSFGCAALSFYLLEKPLMRLGHRLAPPATAGRADLDTAPVAVPAEA